MEHEDVSSTNTRDAIETEKLERVLKDAKPLVKLDQEYRLKETGSQERPYELSSGPSYIDITD